MIDRTAVVTSRPLVLKYADIRSYALTALFVALGLLTPWVFHQYRLAGPTFLPMHIFVLAAGLAFGWRAGLIVGSLTPLASYAVSGMPVPAVLPQTLVELSTYGFVAGFLREKMNLHVIWSLLAAMAAGRLALLLAAGIGYLITGQSIGPLGIEADPFQSVWTAVSQGWPGMVIQIGLIPILVRIVTRFQKRGN